MMWGIGGIVGPPVAGATMDLVGPEGLPITLGVTFAILVIASLCLPLSRLGHTQTYS
jgi:hypothetical protein